MPDDLEIRLLRYFVVVAEELHFSRAAQRLFIAQQALSRDIRRLEDRLGARLFDRTTRRVELTPSGQKLLVRARELISLHDLTVHELRGFAPSMTVDVVGPGLTPALVLAAARRNAPELEFFVRFHTGTEAAVPLLLAERLDVTFGRNPGAAEGLRQRVVRYEPLAVLLPEENPLAELAEIPLQELKGTGLCYRAGNHATPAWDQAILQLLAPWDVDPTLAHPHVQGADELAQHIRDRNSPILTMSTQPPVPGAVLRPVVDPVVLYPWSMIWRADLTHPALDALNAGVDELATDDWLTIPAGAWLPEPEASQAGRVRR
ncbi:LysR family transcriptional regulator StgR [Kribbella koreensis]|uniref:LysR family transcriptional regulator StgR n=1 Tax=Kribbella koreensis TaxID=57909 RepID=A0ABP4CBD1_9ACTN